MENGEIEKLNSSLAGSFEAASTKGDGASRLGFAVDDELAQTRAALHNEFFRAAERGDAGAVMAFLRAGGDPNLRRHRSGDTALHIAATRGARDVVRVLIESGRCDHLLRDGPGRLASENAYLYGRDPALARLLGVKERRQGEAQGLDVTRRPKATGVLR